MCERFMGTAITEETTSQIIKAWSPCIWKHLRAYSVLFVKRSSISTTGSTFLVLLYILSNFQKDRLLFVTFTFLMFPLRCVGFSV